MITENYILEINDNITTIHVAEFLFSHHVEQKNSRALGCMVLPQVKVSCPCHSHYLSRYDMTKC